MNATTVKRLAILIVVLGLVGGASFYTQQVRVEQTARAEMTKADVAEKEGKFSRAEELYRLHLKVFPKDVDVQLKYADAILKGDDSFKRREQAFQIYQNVLNVSQNVLNHAQRDDVRRKLMKMKIDSKHFITGGLKDEGADADLKILLARKEFEHDGDLWFWLGRCQEEGNDAKEAVNSYRKAIEYKAPTKQIDAYQRCASLLRDKLEPPQPEEADRVIKAMVDANRKNYQVYLERGRYWSSLAAKTVDQSSRKSLLSDAKDDFEEARKQAGSDPEPWLELAGIAQNESRYDEAKQILEQGLEKIPTATEFYDQLAKISAHERKIDEAIKILETGLSKLKSTAEQGRLRYPLADLLAQKQDTGKLDLQIKEMERTSFPPVLVDYFRARNFINKYDFVQACQLLTSIRPAVNRTPRFAWLKVPINLLLAQCYSHLGEPEKQRDANLRAYDANLQAYSADPKNLAKHLDWIEDLVNQGDTEGAIREYRTIVDRAPEIPLRLAQLLIERNTRRPKPQQDWSEIEGLVKDAQKAAPESPKPIMLRAAYLVAQAKPALAREELEKAQARFPKSVELRIAQATVLGDQGQVDLAFKLLDQAKNELGDQVELRLARARLWRLKRGPEVGKALHDLAQNIEVFPKKEDRYKLLDSLTIELVRQQDFEEASRILSLLAEQKPKDMQLRLKWLDLAFQLPRTDDIEKFNKRKGDIEKYITQIGEIEGNDGSMGRYCQARYLIWQAEQLASDSAQKAQRAGTEAQRAEAKAQRAEVEALRAKARLILNELKERRADWAQIPLALAQMEERELFEQNSLKDEQTRLTDEEKQAKEKRIIEFYLQAIRLGYRLPAVLRLTVGLLIKNHRGDEALDLLNSIPVGSQLASDLGRQASQYAVEKGDYDRAEQIARKAVEAHPGEFTERFWLVWILLSSGHQAEAETELRKAVDDSKSDPDRWVSLVNLMVVTKQPEKAEDAIREAQANLAKVDLPQAQGPLALARCCEFIGKAKLPNEEAAAKWYHEATEWYQKAEAAYPADLSIKRRFTEFLLWSNQLSDAEIQLKAIVKLGGADQAAETKAWARRMLALVLAFGNDKQRRQEALLYFEPNNQPAAIGQEGKSVKDPEDLRILAKVLDFQRTAIQRKRAIEILESLANRNLATPEDRFLLAQLCELSGDWPTAHEKYRDLNLRTKVLANMETLKRRPTYLKAFAESLLQHRQAGDEKSLADVEELVDEIKQLQPKALDAVIIQLKLCKARNQLDKAADLVRTISNRAPEALERLAAETEKLGLFELAKEVYTWRSEVPDLLAGKLLLAAFLGRRGDAKHALDICEPLWANARDLKTVAGISIDVLIGANSTHSPSPDQLKRVGEWIDHALAQPQPDPSTTWVLLAGLGNIREQQGDYQGAKAQYERAIKQGDRGGVAYNNLAWLTALKDNNPKPALEYINKAIALKPSQPDFLDTRGIINLTAGDILSAINDLTKAVAIDPSPSRLFHLAQAYLADNNTEKAMEYLRMAKSKGFTPGDLHALERPAYQKMLDKLGPP